MSLSSLQSPRATDPEDDCGAHAEQGVDGRDELPSFLDEAGTLVPPGHVLFVFASTLLPAVARARSVLHARSRTARSRRSPGLAPHAVQQALQRALRRHLGVEHRALAEPLAREQSRHLEVAGAGHRPPLVFRLVEGLHDTGRYRAAHSRRGGADGAAP